MTWSKTLTVSILLLFLLPLPILSCNATSENVATSLLTEAENTLTSTYEVVLEAEEAGANVSGLFDELNLAAEYLAEAYIYHRLGIAEKANRFADLSISAVEAIRSEALELRDEAKRAEENASAMNMFGSTVGALIVAVSCFILWQFFKRHYYRRISKSSPEVISGES